MIGLYHPESREDFFIRALLRPDFSCLSFPQRLHRAKRNSIDIFPEAVGKKVTGIYQYLNERAFLLQLEDEKSILFKMHGNRSNLIFCENNTPVELFNNRLQQDISLKLDELDRSIQQDYENLVAHEGNYKKLFPTFGKLVKEYLELLNYHDQPNERKWELIQEVLKQLNNNEYYILSDDIPEFSLLKNKQIKKVFNDPLSAVSEFYVQWLKSKNFNSKKAVAIRTLTKELKKDHSYIQKTRQKLQKIESEINYRQWADLLMANMHKISVGEKEVYLENFYNNNEPITISLNPELSPQKNAERYYQKAKNQHREIENLKDGLKKRETDVAKKEQQLKEIEAADNIDELKENYDSQENPSKEMPVTPAAYHHFKIEGYDVYVGKGAKQNDELLKSYSKKDDLWLHARAAAGSHVIIRQKNRENIPPQIIEKAAQLAAFNSKRKTDTLCPVMVTERKYVRKRKGDRPGAVVVDREEVIMVEPKMYEEYLVK